MKRELDLVRKILIVLEEHEHGLAPREFEVAGYTDEQIGFHAHLMAEAGLIEAVNTTHMGSASETAIPRSITWAGYEFLEAARNETIWEKAKAKAANAGLGMMFDVMKELAIGYARSVLPA